MGDSIPKGIGEQLGGLVKQIATDVVKAPSQIIGIDETKGQGTGGSKSQTQQSGKSQKGNQQDTKQQEEIDKQRNLAQARRLLQQLSQPPQPEPSIREKIEQEEMQKKQAAMVQQQQVAKRELPKIASRPKPWSILKKQSGSETKLNVKAQ